MRNQEAYIAESENHLDTDESIQEPDIERENAKFIYEGQHCQNQEGNIESFHYLYSAE
jgi:hypothetical protein